MIIGNFFSKINLRYVLSLKWFNNWKKYVKYENEKEDFEHPKEVDNQELLEKGELKENLIEEKDFVLVPSSIWKKLIEIYKGGPEIKRKVIEEGEKKTKRIETYPLKIQIFKTTDGKIDLTSQTTIFISKTSSYVELQDLGNQEFKTKESRLWNLQNFKNPILIPDTSLKKSLEEELIQNNHSFLFEMKHNDIYTMKMRRPTLSENFTYYMKYVGNKMSMTSISGGISKGKGELGLCGLSNLGNTCYMNSAIQCLSNTKVLNDYFIKDLYKTHINKSNPLGTKGKLATTYANTVKKLWSGVSSISPVELKYVIGTFATQFNGTRQHDSQELLAFLLDGLHEDLNLIIKKPYIELKEGNGENDELIASQAWEDHLKRNKSIIVDLFQGQLKSTLTCPDCKKISIKFDPYMYLSLPIPQLAPTCISVIFLDKISAKMSKYSCYVPTQSTIGELKSEFYKVLGFKEDIVFADMNGYKVNTIMKDTQTINDIKGKDRVLCFRKPKDIENPMEIIISHRVFKKDTREFKNSCIPAILYTNLQITGEDLYKYVGEYVQRMSNVKDEKEQYFNLSFIKETGESCGNKECKKEKCLGCIIPQDNQTVNFVTNIISIDWKDQENYKESEAMTVISIPSKSEVKNMDVKLKDCFQKFSEPEKLGPNDTWYCPACKDHKQAQKKVDIYTAPDYLIIHIKRFIYQNRYGTKLSTFVDFPIEGLDISSFLGKKPDQPILYDLYAISNHSGTLYGGHYTADCKNIDGKWYHFNDSYVTFKSKDELKSSSAYVLFYKRQKPKND